MLFYPSGIFARSFTLTYNYFSEMGPRVGSSQVIYALYYERMQRIAVVLCLFAQSESFSDKRKSGSCEPVQADSFLTTLLIP